MSDGQMSLNEVINQAVQAEQAGVPVNWKELCMTVYNVATNHIANLEGPHDDDAAEQE